MDRNKIAKILNTAPSPSLSPPKVLLRLSLRRSAPKLLREAQRGDLRGLGGGREGDIL